MGGLPFAGFQVDALTGKQDIVHFALRGVHGLLGVNGKAIIAAHGGVATVITKAFAKQTLVLRILARIVLLYYLLDALRGSRLPQQAACDGGGDLAESFHVDSSCDGGFACRHSSVKTMLNQ